MFVILSENQGETGLHVIHVISVVKSFRMNEKDRNNKTSLTTDSNKKKANSNCSLTTKIPTGDI